MLVGGGHAHLYVIKHMKSSLKARLHVVLVSNHDKQYYSGMASGSLEGYYSEDDMSVDLMGYSKKHHVNFIKNTVQSVNPDSKALLLGDGTTLSYDYVSFDVGSVAKTNLFTKDHDCFLVKPLTSIYDIRAKILDLCVNQNPEKIIKFVVVGTGAAGIEVGLAAKTLAESKKMKVDLTFVGSSSEFISGLQAHPDKDQMNTHTIWQDIQWTLKDPALEISQNEILLQSGKKINFDILILATGVKGQALFTLSGIKTDDLDFMIVNDYLQSNQYPTIFGAGDCVSFDKPLNVPKNGVYAIKAAKVLVTNLEHVILGKPLVAFRPQKYFLSIIALREGLALIVYNHFTWMGRLPFYIKKWIDQNYMKRLKR